MANNVEIIVDCFEGNKVKIDVEGTVGSKCKAQLDKLDHLGTTTEEHVKPEYYKSEPANNLNVNSARRY
jgi:hypothetical protein